MTHELGEARPQPALSPSDQPVNVTRPTGMAAPEPADSVTVTPIRRTGRRGFLPITTNTFDRCFISVVCFVAIHLLWMRLVEAFIPLFVATIISLILAVIIVRWG